MPEYATCANCGCRIILARPTAVDASSGKVPEGYVAAPHLCCDCVPALQARRHPFWGWIFRPRGPAREDR